MSGERLSRTGLLRDDPKAVPGGAPKRSSAITSRAITIALVLILVNLRWTAEVEILYFMFPSYFVPYFTSIVTIFLLALGNRMIANSPYALRTGEMLAIFVMLNAALSMLSCNFLEILIYLLPYPAWQGDQSLWVEVFTRTVPPSVMVTDPVAVKNFFLGSSSIYRWENLRPWLLPTAIWVSFIGVLVWVMYCMSAVLRKQWVQNERLAFPVVPMYMEMIDESGALYRNRLMWFGFAVAGALTLWNGFAYLYPWVPAVHYKPQPIDSMFETHPWLALRGTRFGVLFSTVAIAFFMPLELSMSCWIFYLMHCVQKVVFAQYALAPASASGLPVTSGLVFGSYLGVCVAGIWAGKDHFKSVVKMAMAPGRPRAREPHEPLTDREAVVGLVVGALALAGFVSWIGLSPLVVPAFLGIYGVLSVAITRIRAEFSFPVHDLHWMGPQNILLMVCGSSILGPRNLSALFLFQWFNRVYTSHPMPHQMESLKMGELAGSDNRKLMKCFMAATVIGAALAMWACLDVIYMKGAATAKVNVLAAMFPLDAYGRLDAALVNPTGTDTTQATGISIGFASAVGLAALRRMFFFFPFHPLGFAMAPSWAMWFLWTSMLVGSVAKAVTLKFGGLKVYRSTLAWFFGALLGEFVVGGLWTVAGIVFGVRTYPFFE